MQFIEKLALQPSADHILLIKILIVLIYLIHVPYVSILIGSSFFSIAFNYLSRRNENPMYAQFAKDLVEFVTSNKAVIILLGILPLFTLVFLYGQLFQDTRFAMVNYLLVTAALLLFGFFALLVYRFLLLKKNSTFFTQTGAGLTAFGLFSLAYIIFISATSMVYDPEKWWFANTFAPILSDVYMLPRYLLYFTIAFTLFGGSILFFFLILSERKKLVESNQNYANFIKKFASIVTFSFILIQPLFLFWSVYIFPVETRSVSPLVYLVLALFVLLILTFLIYKILQNEKFRYGVAVFLLILLSFVLYTISDQYASSYANEFHEQSLIKVHDAMVQKVEAEREARSETAEVIDGKQIFTSICASCHSFDRRIVGPPFNEVLPQFEQNQEGMIKFIMNPYKVNPDYPPMPNFSLTRAQAKAVSNYLLGQLKQQQQK